MKKVEALGENIIVEELGNVEEITEGGIVVPQSVTPPQKYGKVISAGELVKGITPGDTLMFHNHGGQAIILASKVYRVLKYPEIYGKVNEVEMS